MIYQGELVYLVHMIKYQLLLLERIQGGSQGLKTPPILRLRRGGLRLLLRATIMYLLLKIVSVLNVTDEC